jgi:hypothetical protein
MVALAWIAGVLGGLCMVMGILTATEVLWFMGDKLTWLFWFALSGVLLLISIVFTLGRGEGEY